MNLKQLRSFCEIVDAGNIATAAERLLVAPTAVSMQLGQLELHLGGQLFDRSRRPMELTSLGRYFFPRAKELLAQAQQLDEDTRGIVTGQRGCIGIGFVRSTLVSLLPMTIRRFRESHPAVHIDVQELFSFQQPEQLRNWRIDVGISRQIGELEKTPGLCHCVVLADPYVVAVPMSHDLAGLPSIPLDVLNRHPLIVYPNDPRSPYVGKLLAALKDAGVTPAISHKAIEVQTALALVAAGLGFSLVGRSVSNHDRSDVAFIPIRDSKLDSRLVATTRLDENRSVVKAFLTHLTEIANGSSWVSGCWSGTVKLAAGRVAAIPKAG